MSDPLWVIIRRKNAAKRARDVIYGHEARPIPGDILTAWALMIAHYCGKGFMRYGEMLAVAESLAGLGYREEMVGVREFRADLDDYLRQQFSKALTAKAKQIRSQDAGARQEAFREALGRARQTMWAKDAALAGRCPACGDKDPERCGCGFGSLVPDGAGGLAYAR